MCAFNCYAYTWIIFIFDLIFLCLYRKTASHLYRPVFIQYHVPPVMCLVLHVVLPGMPVIPVATIFPLTTFQLSIVPQVSIDSPFPAVGPARGPTSPTKKTFKNTAN